MKKYVLILMTGLLYTLSSCDPATTAPKTTGEGKDRTEMLTHLADSIVIPAYASFKTKFDGMMSRSEAFATTPNATTLAAFRTAWTEAYTEWQKVELFEFGPAERQTLRNFFNIYPADTQGIAMAIADPSTSLEIPASYAYQGFPALDYLLNGVGNNDTEIVAYYSTATDGAKRIAYLKRVVTRMNTLLTTVVSEWNGPYRSTFISKTGLDAGSSTSLMVNALVLHYERFIRSGKFGIPSGAMTGVIYPEKVEAFYKKDVSLTLAQTAHQAYVDFFNGKSVKTSQEGPSLKAYLNTLNAKDLSSGKLLSDIINAQFEVSKAKMSVLKPNLYEQVQTNNQAMKDVYTEMQKAVRMLKVDMTSAMSITITYTDNDGD